jgi:CRISPR system Cascade subunit CasA
MNLIEDAWLPVIRANGQKEKIAVWQIAESNNPVIEIQAPRPDFQGALYQFLIGLLQTGFAPEDHDEWLEYWEEMPEVSVLKEHFERLAPAFILDNLGGPAFMQDLKLEKSEKKPISSLLIEAPGAKTMKDNLDFFIKRGTVSRLCSSCTGAALFTLQSNAPSGGSGHRVGLRGGGPLTTLVRPIKGEILWNRLWLNVLDEESFTKSISVPDLHVFPWLASTRVSDKKGMDTRPEDVHPLQMFWGMPRRIRICFEDGKNLRCDLCGEEGGIIAKEYETQNYGVNYEGEWIHPLTPYRFDRKKQKPPLSLKGQEGGLGYRHWLGLVWADPFNGDCASQVVREYMQNRARDIGSGRLARLWCFGYDMDNMKARCWYDHTLPLFRLDSAQRENAMAWGLELINAARETVDTLRQQVKTAWFRRPKDVKGDTGAVALEFWQKSETDFYQLLEQLARLPGEQRQAPPEIYAGWKTKLWSFALSIFDAWVLEAPAEDLDMRRIVVAREGLKKKLATSKAMKALTANAKSEGETA